MELLSVWVFASGKSRGSDNRPVGVWPISPGGREDDDDWILEINFKTWNESSKFDKLEKTWDIQLNLQQPMSWGGWVGGWVGADVQILLRRVERALVPTATSTSSFTSYTTSTVATLSSKKRGVEKGPGNARFRYQISYLLKISFPPSQNWRKCHKFLFLISIRHFGLFSHRLMLSFTTHCVWKGSASHIIMHIVMYFLFFFFP